VWVDIKEKSIKKLYGLQTLFVKTLLHLPDSTPVPALRAITGQLGMKWRVWQEKFLLTLAIKRLGENTLAKGMFQQQVMEGWPGLTEEATEISKVLRIPDVCREEVTKEEVKEAIMNHHHAALKREMEGKEKCGPEAAAAPALPGQLLPGGG
jgi:hypothetical protein